MYHFSIFQGLIRFIVILALLSLLQVTRGNEKFIFKTKIGGTLQFVGVQSDPSTVQNTNSNLIVFGSLLTQIPVSGSMVITAPNEVSINSGSLTCNFVIPSTGTVSQCTASGRTITIILSSVIPADAFEVHVQSVLTNPASTTTTSSFTISTFSANSTPLDSLSTGIALTATQGTLQSQSLTPSSQVVGATANLQVTFTPTHSLPANSIIKVTFPKWNPNASSPTDYLQGSISCTTVAVLSATLSCAFSSSVLTVTGAFGTKVSGGIQVAFTVTSFRNPISTASVSGFSILVTDANGGSIDSGTASVQVTTAATITGGGITVDSSVSSSIAGIVQETNKLRLSFFSPVPLNSNCVIKVTLPSQFSLSTINTVQIAQLFGAQTTATITKSSADNSFTFTSCTAYTTNTASALIIIDSLKLPNYNKPTASFSIAISTSSGNSVASVSSGITFTATPGTIVSVATVATTAVILQNTGIIFTIQPKHTLDITTEATITMPSTYTLGTSCSITAITNTNAAASCTFSGSTITINKLLSTAYIGGSGSSLAFRIDTIQLPMTNVSVSGLGITFLDQDSSDNNFYTVDTFSGVIPLSFGYGTFSRVVANPGSLNAYAVTTYNIEFTPQHYIPQNGYVQIIYPAELTIPDTSYSQSSCTNFSSTFPSAPSCVITSSNRTITISNGFRTITVPPGGTKFSFNIAGIQNPLSLGTTSSFQITSFTQNGIIMDIQQTGITVTMTLTAIMKSVSVIMGSYINAAVTSYTFTITASVPILASNYVIIKFPPEITLPSSDSILACTSSDSTIFNSVKCNLNTAQTANSVKVTLNLLPSLTQINILQTFRITVNGITNPNTTQQSSDFSLQVTDKQFSPINQSPSGISVSTNTPFTLQKATIQQNTTGASQLAQYNITIYPQHDIQIGGGIYLVYPSQVTNTSAIQVQVISSYSKSTPTVQVTVSARQILIRNAFQLKVVGSASPSVLIVLSGFINPSTSNVATSFQVKTFNEQTVNNLPVYYYIDQVQDGLVLNSPCDYPCSTCTTSLSSNCTSCYPTSTLNKLQGGTCVSLCSTGKYYNSLTGACQDCSSPCLGCNGTATNCTTCGLQNYLYLYNNTCSSTCPSKYVIDSTLNQCLKCNAECATCALTPATCTSCTSSTGYPFLYQSTCLKTCPTQLTVPSGNTCQACDTMCKSCLITTTNCTSCYSYMRYDSVLNTCLAACTPDTQIYNQTTGQCLYCSDNCLTCSGTTSTCTSCSNGQVLNIDNTCKSSCNSTNQIPISNVCQQCELPCSQCKGTLDHCTKCQGDYLLYNTTCVQYCPEKYVANNDTGQCILVGLICPTGYTVNEAGDGCIPNEFECPDGYEINSQKTACVPQPGSPVPFPFLIFSCILSLLVLGSWIKDKFFTKIYSNLLALLSFQEMLMYLLMLAYSGANQIWGAFATSLIAVLMLMTANIIFYLYYKRDVMQDEVFAKWQRSFPKTSKYLPMVCLFVNFKCIRLFYSGFYGLESCLAQFEDSAKNLFRPLRMMTYFNYIFIYIPIIIADIFVFVQVKWGFQLLVLAIETFLLTITIMILTFLEFRHPERLIIRGDESYTRFKPKYFNGESMVMAGMIDVDESTLIRTKVVDDDYEIFLRKKAFVSILQQVEKNYKNAIKKGLDLGGKIDQVMSKFDEKRLKLRRAFSLEEIREEEWHVEATDQGTTNGYYTKKPEDDEVEDDDDQPRRYSYPLTPKSRQTVPDPQFKSNLNDIKQAQIVVKEVLNDNVYAECKAPDKNKEKDRRKNISRRTQTYLRELLQLEGDELHESDLEIVMEDDAEIDADYTKDLIENLIDGISESESNAGGKKRAKKKRKNLNTKRTKEIPEFELADIMGDFEIDDLGNFIILRGEKGELLDKKERRVNRRGYLIDRFGNIINKQGQIIFKAVELDSDDEIPAPFGFEKRKKNLLNLGQDGEFKVQGNDKEIEDDEDLIDRELRNMRKTAKRKKKDNTAGANGQIVEEEDDNDEDESSVDSLMAESPGKYQIDQLGDNEDEIIANVTKKKIPVKRGQQKQGAKKNLKAANDLSPEEQQLKKAGPLQNLPPKRIKKEDTRDMFPSLAIESSEQKKLFKIAEQIGSMANQIAENTRKPQPNDDLTSMSAAEKLDQLKQEHFKDLMSQPQAQMSTISHSKMFTSDKKLPPRQANSNMEKIYGNLGDVVNYEEQLMKEQYKGMRAQSPFSSQMTTRMNFNKGESTMGTDKRRLKGLESIYLQKFDKKAGLPNPKKALTKPRFRDTLLQFADDPELLANDGIDRMMEREMTLQVADKLDKLQKQYMSNTTTNNFKVHNQSATSMGFMQPTVGAAVIRKNGSLTGSLFNQDPSLEPVKKGNWVQRD